MGCFDSSKSESKSTAKDPSQTVLLKKTIDKFTPELDKGPDIFPGGRVTPFSTLQEQAVSGAGNFAELFSTPAIADPAQTNVPLNVETGQALGGILAGTTGAKPLGTEDVSSFFDRAIKDPTLKGFREDVIPGISEAFAGPGFFGSARSQEISKATQDVNEQLGAQRAALEFNVLQGNQQLQEAAAGRSLAAIPQALAFGRQPTDQIRANLDIASQQLGGLGEVFGFGKAEQTQAQAELQDEIIRFAEANQIVDPADLAIILSLLNLNFGAATSESSGPGLGFSAVSGLAGGFGAGFGQALGGG